jgi:hypothetical protein
MKLIPVEDNLNLRKDPRSGAIVNIDTAGYEAYMEIVRARNLEKETSNQRIVALETQVNTIMDTLSLILEKVTSK